MSRPSPSQFDRFAKKQAVGGRQSWFPMNGSRNIYTKSDVRESCSGIATISRSAVLVLCQAPSHTPTASVHQFATTKTLSLPKCVHKHPLLFDRHRSFRPVVLDRLQFALA